MGSLPIHIGVNLKRCSQLKTILEAKSRGNYRLYWQNAKHATTAKFFTSEQQVGTFLYRQL